MSLTICDECAKTITQAVEVCPECYGGVQQRARREQMERDCRIIENQKEWLKTHREAGNNLRVELYLDGAIADIRQAFGEQGHG